MRCRAAAPAANDKAGKQRAPGDHGGSEPAEAGAGEGSEHLETTAAQSQQRQGLGKTFRLKVAREFMCFKNSGVRLASCLGWKNKRN